MKRFFTLKEIEGVIVHDVYLKKEAARRAEAFEYLADPAAAAGFIGGETIDPPPVRCDWMMKKELFPQVECYVLFSRRDDELPSSLRILFAGERAAEVKGEDLAVSAIAVINHLIRFIRLSNPGRMLPEICVVV